VCWINLWFEKVIDEQKEQKTEESNKEKSKEEKHLPSRKNQMKMESYIIR
jgi:hypothetical protein